MKRINEFLEKAGLIKIYLVSAIIVLLFSLLFINLVENKHLIDVILNNGKLIWILIGIIAFIDLFITIIFYQIRRSTQFWNYSKIVEALIHETPSHDGLLDIYGNEFNKLSLLANGQPHYDEVRRIHAILDTKYRYLSSKQ